MGESITLSSARSLFFRIDLEYDLATNLKDTDIFTQSSSKNSIIAAWVYTDCEFFK